MKDLTIKIYLQPKASRNEIVGPYRDGIKVRVTAPPVEGKANEELLRLLCKEWKIPHSHIEIARGQHSREKVLKISADKGLDFLRKDP